MVWTVQVRFLPRRRFLTRRIARRRWRRRSRDLDVSGLGDLVPDGGGQGGSGHSGGLDLDGFDEGVAIALVVVGFVLAVLLRWLLVIPLLLLVVDVVVVVALLVAGVLARVVLRRPWEVVAGHPGGERAVVTTVLGWRAALRRRDVVAGRLAKGAPVDAVTAVRAPRTPSAS
ncbi:hypothetical protein [Kineococcus sp. R86509]|uniref:hypothetical protein n=1 Tax=Kineococcus sp. R86509 TaxID=3093851 RepID=UPI0036D422BC